MKRALPAVKQEPVYNPLIAASLRTSQSSSSQPRSSKATGQNAASPMQTATGLRQNSALVRPAAKALNKPRPSSSSRSVKKENAPPPREMEAISVSSETTTHISISSNSVMSLASSSIVDITPIEVKQERSGLDVVDLTVSPRSRRRSPRLRSRESPKKRRKLDPNQATNCKGLSRKKQSEQKITIIASDDEAIDLDGAEEVVYAYAKPESLVGKIDTKAGEVNVRIFYACYVLTNPECLLQLITPAPSNTISLQSPRKRARTSVNQPPPDDAEIEVIPSSQSDERELTVPNKTRKSLKEVEESVRAWRQASQDPQEPGNSLYDDPWKATSDQGDTAFGMDVDYGWDRPDSPLADKRPQTCVIELTNSEGEGDPNLLASVFDIPHSSNTTPTRHARVPSFERNSQLHTPECSSPISDRMASLDISGLRPEVTIVPPASSAKSSTPPTLSSTSSTTKDESLTPRTPPPKQITARLTPMSDIRSIPDVLIETPRSKTARLIAKIKEKAAKAADLSEEEEDKNVPATLSSESELGEPEDFFVKSTKEEK